MKDNASSNLRLCRLERLTPYRGVRKNLTRTHRLIDLKEVFRGTLTQTAVYPREVVKLALARNAAAVLLAHNHPSGAPEPSQADQQLTRTLKEALALVGLNKRTPTLFNIKSVMR